MRMLINVLTRASWIQHSPSRLISFKSNLRLSSYLLPYYLPDIPTKTLCAFLFSPMLETCPTHLVLLRLIVLIISDEEYRSRTPCHVFILAFVKYTIIKEELGKKERSSERRKIETERGWRIKELQGERNRQNVRSTDSVKTKIHGRIVPWELKLWDGAVIMNWRMRVDNTGLSLLHYECRRGKQHESAVLPASSQTWLMYRATLTKLHLLHFNTILVAAGLCVLSCFTPASLILPRIIYRTSLRATLLR